MSKGQRHHLIRELVRMHEIETQEDLVRLLCEKGMKVTQATVSRDIKELNLIKIPLNTGSFRYSLVGDVNYKPHERLERSLVEVFEKLSMVGPLIVLKISPGNAHVIGALLDQIDWPEMLGTVCGNDTCLIICRSDEDAIIMNDRLLKYVGMETANPKKTFI
ncbi:arginine repressor [Robertmurraya siralis]|uniref:Arginine repressor n=1 Tax=Robertmurraya siralis TaxID=77777 RepID=A0A919WIH9_9BACI|nr:transcriptional regulator ArgR [Robertmurraya siralis]PAE20592.1 arginine repressor [Bacillus sp. 7504-2]GIN62423.1 arginine repressor [Robertmurraya siralis]